MWEPVKIYMFVFHNVDRIIPLITTQKTDFLMTELISDNVPGYQ